jgi:hypothetical protein
MDTRSIKKQMKMLLERANLDEQEKTLGSSDKVADLSGEITIPLIGIIKRNTFKDDADKIIEGEYTYEIKWDFTQMEKDIQEQLTPIFEKLTKDKVAQLGGKTLLGFPNTFWNNEYKENNQG